MNSNSTGVAREIRIFSSLARELVSELLCQFSFADFSSSLKFKKFKNLANLTSHSTFTAPVIQNSHYYSLTNVSFKPKADNMNPTLFILFI